MRKLYFYFFIYFSRLQLEIGQQVQKRGISTFPIEEYSWHKKRNEMKIFLIMSTWSNSKMIRIRSKAHNSNGVFQFSTVVEPVGIHLLVIEFIHSPSNSLFPHNFNSFHKMYFFHLNCCWMQCSFSSQKEKILPIFFPLVLLVLLYSCVFHWVQLCMNPLPIWLMSIFSIFQSTKHAVQRPSSALDHTCASLNAGSVTGTKTVQTELTRASKLAVVRALFRHNASPVGYLFSCISIYQVQKLQWLSFVTQFAIFIVQHLTRFCCDCLR